MQTLEASDCHYVCCIKPNDLQQPGNYQEETILRQLRYLGERTYFN